MLQARIMSYLDAQRYRLGANYQQLPVNQPKCPRIAEGLGIAIDPSMIPMSAQPARV